MEYFGSSAANGFVISVEDNVSTDLEVDVDDDDAFALPNSRITPVSFFNVLLSVFSARVLNKAAVKE